ncbi:MAG: putative sulfate/molybdate transporter [Dehalococcoidia bacterium]
MLGGKTAPGHLLPIKFSRPELGGALADLGTLLPLVVALISINRMNPTTILLLVGLLYIASGLYYRIPVPVQPLKAFAAIAIALGLAPGVISAGGLIMGILLLFLAVTGLVGWVVKLFPKPVVRGIQLGVGLILLRTALKLILEPGLSPFGPAPTLGVGSMVIPLGVLLALVGIILVLLLLKSRRLPASLAVLGLGLGVSAYFGLFRGLDGVGLGFDLPALHIPTGHELYLAFFLLVVPQIPLTLGNAVVGMEDTARVYFGEGAARVRHRTLCTSMGLTNLVAGALGGMPVCHGAGGLSAHYRFGARTGACGVIIGSFLLVLALLLGRSVMPVLSLVPLPILGVLLVFTGVQHALLARDMRAWRDRSVVVLIAVLALTTNLAIGFTLGIIAYHVLRRYHVVSRFLASALDSFLGLFR